MNDDDARIRITFERAGMLTTLSGLKHARDIINAEIDLITSIVSEEPADGVAVVRRGRLPKAAKVGYWNKMTPEQRSAEMRRRALKGRKVKKVRSGTGGYWDKMTAEERSAEMKRRRAARTIAGRTAA